jgi:hypothetical protein
VVSVSSASLHSLLLSLSLSRALALSSPISHVSIIKLNPGLRL